MKTKPAPLPHKGAPLGMQDIIMERIQFEDRLLPHLEYVFPEEELKRELPSTKWTPTVNYVFNAKITNFVLSLLP